MMCDLDFAKEHGGASAKSRDFAKDGVMQLLGQEVRYRNCHDVRFRHCQGTWRCQCKVKHMEVRFRLCLCSFGVAPFGAVGSVVCNMPDHRNSYRSPTRANRFLPYLFCFHPFIIGSLFKRIRVASIFIFQKIHT